MSSIELYQIKGFDWEWFISLYLREVVGYEERTYSYCITADEELEHGWIGAGEYEKRKAEEEERIRKSTIVHEGKRGVKDKDRILCKGMYVQDVILRLAYTKKDRAVFSLNAEIMRSVIGAEYKVMLCKRWGICGLVMVKEERRQRNSVFINMVVIQSYILLVLMLRSKS